MNMYVGCAGQRKTPRRGSRGVAGGGRLQPLQGPYRRFQPLDVARGSGTSKSLILPRQIDEFIKEGAKFVRA
jgi:hypothetical protein